MERWHRRPSRSSSRGSSRATSRCRSSSSTRTATSSSTTSRRSASSGCRFDETGEMPADEWATVFAPTSRGRAARSRPRSCRSSIALQQRRPAHARALIRGLDGVRRRIEVTAFPLDRTGRRDSAPSRSSGRTGRREAHALGHARLAGRARPDTVRYGGNTSCVEVRAADGTRARPRRRHGHPPPGRGDSRASAPGRHPADPPAHGPHPGPRLLRAASSSPDVEVHIWGPPSTTLRSRSG